MKNLIILFSIILGICTQAWSQQHSHSKKITKKILIMDSVLNLSTEQESRITALWQEYKQNSPADDIANRKTFRKELNQVLTEEQKIKWKNYKKSKPEHTSAKHENFNSRLNKLNLTADVKKEIEERYLQHKTQIRNIHKSGYSDDVKTEKIRAEKQTFRNFLKKKLNPEQLKQLKS